MAFMDNGKGVGPDSGPIVTEVTSRGDTSTKQGEQRVAVCASYSQD